MVRSIWGLAKIGMIDERMMQVIDKALTNEDTNFINIMNEKDYQSILEAYYCVL